MHRLRTLYIAKDIQIAPSVQKLRQFCLMGEILVKLPLKGFAIYGATVSTFSCKKASTLVLEDKNSVVVVAVVVGMVIV